MYGHASRDVFDVLFRTLSVNAHGLGAGRGADGLVGFKTAGDLVAAICAQPLGCKGRLIRVTKVDGQQCVILDSGQVEAHLTAHITYGCG